MNVTPFVCMTNRKWARQIAICLSCFILMTFAFELAATAGTCPQLFVTQEQSDITNFLPGAKPNIVGRINSLTEPTTGTTEATAGIIEYLQFLLENTQSLPIEHLIEFRDNLHSLADSKMRTVVNPINGLATVKSAETYIHYQNLKAMFADHDTNWSQVVTWIDDWLHRHRKVQNERSQVQIEGRSTHRPLEFAYIPHGSYTQSIQIKPRRARQPKEVPVLAHLTNDFYVSTTPITQAQWVEVMGHNPSLHREGLFTSEITIDGRQFRMQPDNPVEYITWWSALVYLNRLSQMHGLKPAYDLNHIEFLGPGRGRTDGYIGIDLFVYKDNPELAFQLAARGELNSSGERISDQIPVIRSFDQNIYNTEGFRLPTSYEHEYLRTQLGKHRNDVYADLGVAHIFEHAWFLENSNQRTMPVAMLRGLAVGDGKYLYDLAGNVSEMSHNWHLTLHEDTMNPNGSNEQDVQRIKDGNNLTFFRKISWMGGGYDHSAKQPDITSYILTSMRTPFRGLRIARTVNPPQSRDTK